MKTRERITSPVLLGRFEITLGEQAVPYLLKRSFRASLIWLQIRREGGLCVTVPSGYDVRDLPAYLISRSKWILHHLEKTYASELIPRLRFEAYYQGQLLESKGEDHHRTYYLPNGTSVQEAELTVWLKQQAAEIIFTRVKHFSVYIGVRFAKVTIRDQKTRWGSCSHKGNLSFNWRLIMTPEPVLDYVVVHELCHLKRMSHGKAFWKEVEKHCPDWKEKRRWLNKHCRELHYFHSNSE